MTDHQDYGQPPQYPAGSAVAAVAVQPEQHQRRVGQPPRDPYTGPPVPAVPQYAPQGYSRASPPTAPRKTGLTAAERFWYILGCIPMGAMYFAKIPSKKALADFGMAELTAAESFWYVLMCIAFGGGLFREDPDGEGVSELAQFRQAPPVPLEYRR